MIKFNKKDNPELMFVCNSCHSKEEKKLFELFIGFGNGGQLVYLCPKCAKELKEAIKLR